MSFDDPVRLSAGGSPELRELLRSIAADAPTAAEVERLTAALAPVLQGAAAVASAAVAASTASATAASSAAAGAGAGAAGGSVGLATVAGLGLKAWIVIAAIGATAVAGAVTVWPALHSRARTAAARPAEAPGRVAPRPDSGQTAPRPEAGQAAPPAIDSAPAVPPAAVVAPAPAPAAVLAATGTPPRPGPRNAGASTRHPRPLAAASSTPPPSPSAPPSAPPPATTGAPPTPPAAPPTTIATETARLRDASSALQRGDAQLAFDLAVAYETRYPSGTFREEHERIAIVALVRLGRVDAARDRFARFVQRHPRSGYLNQLQRLFVTAPPR
ncbi:MAG TPA: hypothetical protein VHE35_08640 [Kofleriaceae bacterium]|nr:hypothetical protein [Kofleriaceae bacterium]